MNEYRPSVDISCVYTVKRTCAELGISYKTLRKYRELGYITPVNPQNPNRLKYSGKAILDCWFKIRVL